MKTVQITYSNLSDATEQTIEVKDTATSEEIDAAACAAASESFVWHYVVLDV